MQAQGTLVYHREQRPLEDGFTAAIQCFGYLTATEHGSGPVGCAIEMTDPEGGLWGRFVRTWPMGQFSEEKAGQFIEEFVRNPSAREMWRIRQPADAPRQATDVDPYLANVVTALNHAGFETTSSCQGTRDPWPFTVSDTHHETAYIEFRGVLPADFLELARTEPVLEVHPDGLLARQRTENGVFPQAVQRVLAAWQRQHPAPWRPPLNLDALLDQALPFFDEALREDQFADPENLAVEVARDLVPAWPTEQVLLLLQETPLLLCTPNPATLAAAESEEPPTLGEMIGQMLVMELASRLLQVWREESEAEPQSRPNR